MAKVYLGLGANLGDRTANLVAALRMLGRQASIVRVSPLYETEPVGYVDQPWFLNAACEIVTDKTPREVLALANAVEAELGRIRDVRYGPRTVDVDILLYDDLVVDEPDLQIPHPRMTERPFVLVPLADIAGDVVHPGLQKTINTERDAVDDKSAVRLWKDDWYV